MNNDVKFGLRNIPKSEKTDRVSGVFTSVAEKYDLMNDLMSLGQHRLWKEKLCLIAKIKDNENILDIASGTGDLALNFLKCTSLEQTKLSSLCAREDLQ